ncbi:AMP-binding protein [Pseudoduganella violaceinigra]|uniref:AMP-binding protein n=1 Tax=Pseudoduganella violaceinigra TaxID=246602 RepID=UPI00042678BA|nr:AMP-binding protein [Pseudoduganella violaceinigra]
MRDALLHLAADLGARPAGALAGWRGTQAVSCAALAQRMRDWQLALAAHAGRNFALYLEDSLEFAAALLGAWQAGKTIWLSADALPASCGALRARVDGFIGLFPADCAPLAAPAAAADAPAPRVLDGAFEALVVHTSGSTGAPQAIAKRLSQMASEVDVLEAMFGASLGGDTAVLATVSHQHIYGLLFKVLWPLCAGRPVLADSALYPEELAALLAQRPSLLVSSPAHLKRLPELAGWQAARGQLRAVFSSGGPLPEEAAFACAELLGKAAVEVYGSSETGGVAWRQRSRAAADAAWTAFPNVQWRLDDEGMFAVRSPHLADDHWLQLADRAEATADGRFELRGRADRIVKLEEKRISLDALEAALRASPLVAEARLLLDDSAARACLAAFVVLAPQGREQLAAQGKLALNRALRTLLAGSAEAVVLPRRWRYLAQMPVNTQGKTTHAALAALLADAPAEAGRPVEPVWRELECSATSASLTLTVPPDLLYFDGHFPGSPILPGVVQLDWAIARGRHYFDMPPVFRDVAMLKFQQIIAPGATLQLELAWDAGKSSLQFKYLSDTGQHASGRVLFAVA